MIRLDNISVTLGGFKLHHISFEAAAGDYFVLLGPTGAGKTVLLETIAGLNKPRSGRVYLREVEVTRLSPEERRIGIVYQDQMLFPHLRVRDNVLFGCRARGLSKTEQAATLEWLCGLLQIADLLERRPETLSGGERQKVALARALSVRPDVLLLDEPLSALDPATREEIRAELRRLHRALELTIIHVTHDFAEAASLAARIALLAEGEIKQVGTVADVFNRPASEYVAHFTLARNVFPGRAEDREGQTLFRGDGFSLVSNAGGEGNCTAVIRPEMIRVGGTPSDGAENEIRATVTEIQPGLPLTLIADAGSNFSCYLNPGADGAWPHQPGETVFLTIPAAAVHLIN